MQVIPGSRAPRGMQYRAYAVDRREHPEIARSFFPMGGSSLQEACTCAGCLLLAGAPQTSTTRNVDASPAIQVESTQLENTSEQSRRTLTKIAPLCCSCPDASVMDRNAEISSYPRSSRARRIGCTERRRAIDRPRAHELSLLPLHLWRNARRRRRMRPRCGIWIAREQNGNSVACFCGSQARLVTTDLPA
ncbi:hypothetical protein GGD63_007237 [Bradyrhizobium sp. cir1]|nr:hypothetical protein [Bradyrhizobium sp. cir1]